MKRSKIIAPSVLILGSSIFASAQANVDEYDFNVMKKRVEALEQSAAATTVNGELSATYTSTGKTAWGDAVLTVSHAVNDEFDGSVTIKRDGETSSSEDRIIFDEAMINYNNESFTVSMGRIGVPFGGFATGMLTDPLTKGVTDADKGGKDMLMLSTTLGGIEVAAYTYKDTDNDSGVTIGYGNDMFSVGYDHFNDGTATYSSSNAVRAGFDAGNGMSVAYEKVTTDQAASADKSATHFEANYAHAIAGMDANLAIAKSDENAAQGDSDQTGFTYSVNPAEGVTFAVERNKVKGASAVNTAKITYEF